MAIRKFTGTNRSFGKGTQRGFQASTTPQGALCLIFLLVYQNIRYRTLDMLGSVFIRSIRG